MPAVWSHVMQKNESDLELLRAEAQNVTLNVGDIIIDHIAEMRGILLKRIRHIDMIEDDIFLWEVKLFKNNNSDYTETIMEEEGLKFSIAIGTVECWCTAYATGDLVKVNDNKLGIVMDKTFTKQETMFPYVKVYLIEHNEVYDYGISSLEIVSKA